MKIAFFTDSYLPKIDGVVTSVAGFARELTRQGHAVTVFCPRTPVAAIPVVASEEKQGHAPQLSHEPGPKIIRFNSLAYYFQPEIKLSLPTPLASLREVLKPFDIIHSHSPGPLGILAEEIALLRGIPHIHTFHTLLSEYGHYLFQGRFLSKEAIRRLSAFWCNRVDFILAPSQKIKDELLSSGVARPIEVIPTGVDLGYFAPRDTKVPKKFLLGEGLAKEGEFVFLAVGRLGKEKNLPLILRSLRVLLGGRLGTRKKDLRLLIVGDGPERSNLIRLTRTLGLLAYVSFAGYIKPNEMPKVYQEADCFLHASTSETQGLVVLEAAAAGLPIVAIQDAAVADVVKDQKNGFLVENARMMADFAQRLFLEDNLRIQMSQNSQKVAQEFDLKGLTGQMIKYYANCQIEYSARSRRRRLRKQYERLKEKFKDLMRVE